MQHVESLWTHGQTAAAAANTAAAAAIANFFAQHPFMLCSFTAMPHIEGAALDKIKHLVDFILENIADALFCFAVLFPCTYTLWCTQFKWYPICILTISFTHQYSIDRSRSMSETCGVAIFSCLLRRGPLYLQINVTAERKHVIVTFSLVIHDQGALSLFYFLFAGRFTYAGILCAPSAAACRMESDSGAPHGGEPAVRWKTYTLICFLRILNKDI